MAEVLLDASAVLALLRDEPGGNVVAGHALRWAICAVNVAEVAARLADADMPDDEIQATFGDLGLEIMGFDMETALLSAAIRPNTRDRGLSLGDRACLACARQRDLPVLTADRAWSGLEVGVEIRLIR